MIRGQDIFRFSRIYEVLSISKSLDDILNVSESMVTPLPTPKKSSALIQEPILEVKENPLDFTLKYQSDWNQSEVRTIEAYISGIYPKNPDHWKIKICPICEEWDSNLACNCNQVRELGFYLSLHLKSKPNSNVVIPGIKAKFARFHENFRVLYANFRALGLKIFLIPLLLF